jgi:hypothetical protein
MEYMFITDHIDITLILRLYTEIIIIHIMSIYGENKKGGKKYVVKMRKVTMQKINIINNEK